MKRFVVLVAIALASVACGGGSTTTGLSPQPTSGVTNGGPARAVLPASCAELKRVIAQYVGGVATTKSLGAPIEGVSCEFANANASTIVVINIGLDTPDEFAALRSASAGGGRTTATVAGLGSAAFSVSKGGAPGGMSALSVHNVLISVIADLPFDRDEDLIRQLLSTY